MTNLFWYLRLTPSLTTVDLTLFAAEMPIAGLEAGERGATLVFAVFGTTVLVSSSKERWQLVMPFSGLDDNCGTTQCPVAERSKLCEGWAV